MHLLFATASIYLVIAIVSSIELDERHITFLKNELRTNETRHSKVRTLFDHLTGTYSLLKKWEDPQWICDAGLYHSIYGTQIFKKKSFPLEKRHVLRELIGERAEYLAYLFCVTDRPGVLLSIAESDTFQSDVDNTLVYPMEDKVAGGTISVDKKTIIELLEMESANMMDQNVKSKKLYRRLAASGVKDSIKQDLLEYVATKLKAKTIPLRG